MPKATSFASDLLKLILNATPIPDLAENDSSTPATQVYVAFHTADPGIGGSQLTNEVAYTNYARVPVIRTNAGWTIVANIAKNTAQIQFPQCGVVGATITHISLGLAATGAGRTFYVGELVAPLNVSNAVQPQFSAEAMIVTET